MARVSFITCVRVTSAPGRAARVQARSTAQPVRALAVLHTLRQTPLYQHRSRKPSHLLHLPTPEGVVCSSSLAAPACLGRDLAYVQCTFLRPRPVPSPCTQVMADSRLRAEAEPLRLSRNWFVAVVISLLWLAGLEYCLYLGIDTWGEYCKHPGNQNR